MIKLILLDLDGTLLHSDKTISDYTKAVIERCKKQNILIGISTARGTTNIRPFIEALAPDLIIASGGAQVTYRGETIYASEFTEEETDTIIRTAKRLTNGTCEITVDTRDSHYWNYKIDPQKNDATWEGCIYTDYTDFRASSLKICVEVTDDVLAQRIAASVDGVDLVKFSESDWYKLSKKNATKEVAIKELGRVLGIAKEEMLAFGDDYADIGMLQTCGTGVAMENAIPEVKEIADAITDTNNNDGVAKYLEEFVLEKE